MNEKKKDGRVMTNPAISAAILGFEKKVVSAKV